MKFFKSNETFGLKQTLSLIHLNNNKNAALQCKNNKEHMQILRRFLLVLVYLAGNKFIAFVKYRKVNYFSVKSVKRRRSDRSQSEAFFKFWCPACRKRKTFQSKLRMYKHRNGCQVPPQEDYKYEVKSETTGTGSRLIY